MNTFEIIQTSLNTIEENLYNPLSLTLLAEDAGFSNFYFHRLFSSMTGFSVMDYIRKRRLTEAGLSLARNQGKVIDLAYKCGYNSPEAFSKAFKLCHGISPKEAKTKGVLLQGTLPLNLQNTRRSNTMKVRIETTEPMRLIGYTECISLQDGENLQRIPKLWETLNASHRDEYLLKKNDGLLKGIVAVCDVREVTSIHYTIGCNSTHKIDDDMVEDVIPASQWAVFEAIGPLPQSVQETWQQITRDYFPNTELEFDHSLGLEVYSDEDPNEPTTTTEIWIKIK